MNWSSQSFQAVGRVAHIGIMDRRTANFIGLLQANLHAIGPVVLPSRTKLPSCSLERGSPAPKLLLRTRK